jgi:hypothetical protein
MPAETGGAASDSGSGSSAEAGEGEAPGGADQFQAANDNASPAANDNAAQDASETRAEATADLAASAPHEAGEGAPPEAGEEVPGSSPREVPEPVNEVPEPTPQEVPEPVNEVPEPTPQEVPGQASEAAETEIEVPPPMNEVPEPAPPEVPQQEITEVPPEGEPEVPQQTEPEVPVNEPDPAADAGQTTMADNSSTKGGDIVRNTGNKTLGPKFNKVAGVPEPVGPDPIKGGEKGTEKTTPRLVPDQGGANDTTKQAEEDSDSASGGSPMPPDMQKALDQYNQWKTDNTDGDATAATSRSSHIPGQEASDGRAKTQSPPNPGKSKGPGLG